MSKYGFNPKELRKTIVTKIDKDGFHERTITYGKDSGGSGESSDGNFSTVTVTFANTEDNGESYDVGFYGPIIHNGTLYGATDILTDMSFLDVMYGQNLTLTVPIYNQNLEAAILLNHANDPIFIGDVTAELLSGTTNMYRLTITGDFRIETFSVK